MGDVRLVDLDVFKRYSLAIRQESAPAEELLAVLEASRRQVEAAGEAAPRLSRRRRPAEAPPEPAPAAAPEAEPAEDEEWWPEDLDK
ncbi:MAG TPA: hypothetical protein VFJ85_08710 [Acidimicrobiales bacterium]|nr:hypothetical protein [Acidimicrobiales bacterium]